MGVRLKFRATTDDIRRQEELSTSVGGNCLIYILYFTEEGFKIYILILFQNPNSHLMHIISPKYIPILETFQLIAIYD
jgi:hypothetical protein